MLGAGDLQEFDGLAIKEDHRSDVHVELEVHVVEPMVRCGRPDADAGVVDEHVEAPEALAMTCDDRRDGVGVREVRRDRLHVVSTISQSLRHGVEGLGLASSDGEPVALLGKRLGQRQPDAAAGSGDDGGAVRHESDAKGWAGPRC